MRKIVLTGGGTAGHIYPALAVAERLDGFEKFFIGSSGMEKEIVSKEKDIKFYEIDAVKLERKFTLRNLFIPFKLFSSIRQAKKILKEIKPDCVFSKGGFVALPVVIGAKKLGIKVISHESDLSMGLANKIILHYCDKMCVAFEKTAEASKKCVFTGQPIRESILKGNKNNIGNSGFDKNKTNLLVVGGSLGAKFINQLVWGNLDKLCEKFNIIHIAGKKAEKNVSHKFYRQMDFSENMGDILAWSDLVVSRAGAGAINELLALKKPMLLIPLSKDCSRGDQIENARLFESKGYALVIEQEECTNQKFIENVEKLKQNDKILIKNMQKNSNFNANDKIIEVIEECLKTSLANN